jgi:acetylglutamate kinase
VKKLYIIKIGGNIIDDANALDKFLSDFSNIKGLKILVHGGGKIATELAKKLGIAQTLVGGRRITDAETLKVTAMVYAGLVNKQIVALLQSHGVNALGLCGADANAIQSDKRNVKDVDYGFVGDITPSGIHSDLLSAFLEMGLVPVFSAITHNGKGQLLNTNADTIAATLAAALSKNYTVQLNYCFEKKGVLEHIDQEDSVIKTITQAQYRQLLLAGIISKGMIPKLDNAFEAIQKGVPYVVISHADDLINTTKNEHGGTTLVA